MEPVKEAIRTHSEPIRGARHDARALRANQRCSSRREETHGGSRGARGAQHSASERNGAQHSAAVLESSGRTGAQGSAAVLESSGRTGAQGSTAVLESSGRTGAQGSAYWRARAESHFTSWLLFVPGWLKSCTAAAKRPAKVWRGESAQPDAQSMGDGARLGSSDGAHDGARAPSRIESISEGGVVSSSVVSG